MTLGLFAPGLRRLCALATLLALLTLAPDSFAQSLEEEIRDEIRDQVSRGGFAQAVQSLTGFAALPGVSAANFTVGGNETTSDADIDKYNLPLSRQFSEIGVAGGDLYAELTLAYLNFDQSGELARGVRQQLDINSLSAIGGLGLGFALGPWTTLRPIALFGYSHIEDSGGFSGSDSALLNSVLDGILTDFILDSALFGGALEVEHRRPLGENLNFFGRARYNQLFVDTFEASDPSLEASSDFGVFTAHLEVNGPTGATVGGRQLRWIGYVANSSFTESAGTGIEFFFELGGGIELVDRSVIRGIEGVSLRASGIVGQKSVTGWSVYAQLEF